MSDAADGGGGGGDEEGGFLGKAEGGIEKGLDWLGKSADVMTGLDVANRVSGAYKTYQAFAPFKDLVGSPTMGELWKSGSAVAEEGGGFLGGASKAMGPIGSVMGGITAVGNGLELANDINKEGFSNAYHDQKAYNHAGGALLGAAHAALPWMGPYGAAADLGLSGAEMAANYGGKAAGWAFGDKAGFSADSVAGGLIRGMAGDQSLGEKARQGVTGLLGHGALGNGLGIAADVATNVAMAPTNLANTVGRGVWNEGSAIVDSIANGKGAVGGALHDFGTGAASLASKGWNEAKSIGSSAVNTGKSLVSGAGHALSSGFHAVTSW